MTWRKYHANTLLITGYLAMGIGAGAVAISNAPALLVQKPAVVKTVDSMNSFIDKTIETTHSPGVDAEFRKAYLDSFIATLETQRDHIKASPEYATANIMYEECRRTAFNDAIPMDVSGTALMFLGGAYVLAYRRQRSTVTQTRKVNS